MRIRNSWWGPGAITLAMTAVLVSGCGSEVPDSDTAPAPAAEGAEGTADEPAETQEPAQTSEPETPAETTEPAETDDVTETEGPAEPSDPGGATESEDTGETDQPAETSGPAFPEPPDGGAGRLEVDSIGGVELPADPDAVVGALLPYLGDPDTDDEVAGCLDAPDGGVTHRLVWGDVQAYGTAPTADELQITSWEVSGPAGADDISLPNDVAIGDSTEEAKAAFPEAEWIEGGMHGGPLLLQGDLMISLDGQSGDVISVSSQIGLVSCD